MGIILFKSRLAMSVLHCRNNHVWSTKLIPEKRDQERSRETRRTGIGHVEMKKTLKSVSLRREKPTGLKSSREFKKGEHRSRKLGSFFMEKVNKLI